MVVEGVSSEEGCGWALSLEVLNAQLFQCFVVWTHLSVGSVDGVAQVFVDSTVASNQGCIEPVQCPPLWI